MAELLHMADVSFAVLGNGETCNGDQARRAGNEFVFQGLAQQNVETFKEYKVKKVVSTCAHCFNTLKNEYKDFGIELEVVHHTQLLNRLVREGKLTPVTDGAGAQKRTITYHDPCYIGRHNGVYSPPRELLQVLPGADFVEMPRNSERSFCCGAGGARMWMEENIGTRINDSRTTEAVATGADQIAVGCPFCRVMLSDGLTAAIDKGEAREEVEVLDVAQMLLASVKGEMATRRAPGLRLRRYGDRLKERPEETKAEPEPSGDRRGRNRPRRPSGGSSLFDTPADDAAEEPDEPEPAKPASSGGSLFDLGDDEPSPRPRPSRSPRRAEPSVAPCSTSAATTTDAESQGRRARPSSLSRPPQPRHPAEPTADLGGPAARCSTSAATTPEPESEDRARAGRACRDHRSRGTRRTQPPTSGRAARCSTSRRPRSYGPRRPSRERRAASRGAGGRRGRGRAEEPTSEPQREKPKPASPASEAHQPKTDVDINESGSLFDL